MVQSLLRQPKEFGQGFLVIFLSAITIIASVLSYTTILSRFPTLPLLDTFAYANLVLTLLGLFGISYGLRRILQAEAFRTRTLGSSPSSIPSTLAYIVSQKAFSRIAKISAVAYGSFFAFLSGTVAYQPWLKFSEAYGAKIPSAVAVVGFGPPWQFPQFVVYLTEHFGLLITPLNLILLFAISWLVGINTSLTVFTYRNRPKGNSGNWFSGFGAAIGLFTGCPSCAGLFFATMLGGVGAVSIATALASFQTLFIAVSIPVLIVTPFLTSRNLLRTFTSGCSPISDNAVKR